MIHGTIKDSSETVGWNVIKTVFQWNRRTPTGRERPTDFTSRTMETLSFCDRCRKLQMKRFRNILAFRLFWNMLWIHALAKCFDFSNKLYPHTQVTLLLSDVKFVIKFFSCFSYLVISTFEMTTIQFKQCRKFYRNHAFLTAIFFFLNNSF